MLKKLTNEDLGYDYFFEHNRIQLQLEKYSVARVITEHRGVYRVKNSDGEYSARVTGRQMLGRISRENFPAVGDWVAITELNKEQAIIYKILPRRTIVQRKSIDRGHIQIIATNVDVAFIVESIGRDYNLNRFERYFSIANSGGVKPVVILNKIDLISKEELELKLTEILKRFKDVDIITTSIINDNGLNNLENYITSKNTYCFLGSSGVGKSSLINKLLNKSIIKTGEVGIHNHRGKHVTTSREMYFLENGGIVIDNPGIREVGVVSTHSAIDDIFDEITELAKKCKYVDCTHVHEPDCEVLLALKSGELDMDKYSNYINLKKEAEYNNMSELEKKEKEQKFGKFIKTAKKSFRKKNY
jgi:ribosome biogenesis GTPase